MTTKAGVAGALDQITGRSIIAGKAVKEGKGAVTFEAVDPVTGRAISKTYQCATDRQVDEACEEAWDAFHDLCHVASSERARLLQQIAGNIGDIGPSLLEIAGKETGLSVNRLRSERDRTTATLYMFAQIVSAGEWSRPTIDTGDALRRPFPKPDLRSMLRPLGPIAVFGASNFPLAYSTAGGDTASALAAGCPVIVKGHPLHPGTGEIVARAVADAFDELGIHPGGFGFLHAGGGREQEIGRRLVLNKNIRGVGFTGSAKGGMALARLARDERDDPIPVFAEMGSTNPVFVMPGALEKDAERIAERIAASITNSLGQMCTCPGLIFVPHSDASEQFVRTLVDRLREKAPEAMLAPRILDQYAERLEKTAAVEGVFVRGGSAPDRARRGQSRPAMAGPTLLTTKLQTFLHNVELHAETFGPSAVVVECDGVGELEKAASAVMGSLTGTIWIGSDEETRVGALVEILERRVGRIVFNGVPTGVEVCESMVHGGPYPATNQPHTTAVGPRAIERWARPVAYQNTPQGVLPPELRDANPMKVRRRVDGHWDGGA